MKVLGWKSKSMIWLTKSRKCDFAGLDNAEDEWRRSSDESMAGEVGRKKPWGKPRKQWMDCSKEDSKQVDLSAASDKDGRCLHNNLTPVDRIRVKKRRQWLAMELDQEENPSRKGKMMTHISVLEETMGKLFTGEYPLAHSSQANNCLLFPVLKPMIKGRILNIRGLQD